MNNPVEGPALLIYKDGTGRLVSTSEVHASLDDVPNRYLDEDLLIDRRGRVFLPSRICSMEHLLAALRKTRPPPLEVSEDYTDEQVDNLVSKVTGVREEDLASFKQGLQFARGATW